MAALMVGVGEEDLKQKENAQLNSLLNTIIWGLPYERAGMLVRKLENFRATLSDIFMGKSIGFLSQNEHFRHFHLGILSQD